MGWNLDDSITRDELKKDRQKERNRRQKSMIKMIGENLASYACVLILILLVSFIWTDIGIFINVTSFLSDAVVTVILYVLADFCMTQSGSKGGRLDDVYIVLHEEYLALRDRVRQVGIANMDAFCDWQVDVEYEYHMRRQCKAFKVDYDEFINKYVGMTLEELKRIMSKDKALKVYALTQVKRIELTPDILLTDGKVRGERGGVPLSGEEYVERHTTGWQHILMTAIFAIVAAVPVFTLTQDVSVGRVIYTVFKLAMMCYRMYRGYMRGAKGFNTVEPKHLQAKIKYLYLYLEFLEKKIYISLAGKYNIYTEEAGHENNRCDSGGRRVEAELGVGRAEDAVGA